MTNHTQATTTDQGGLLEAAAVILSALTAFGAVIQPRPDTAFCLSDSGVDLERRAAPIDRKTDVDVMLRNMRMRD